MSTTRATIKRRLAAIKRPITATIPCGCVYFTDNARGPLTPCAEHRYITCGKCHGQGQATPFGFMCPRCSFGAYPSIADEATP